MEKSNCSDSGSLPGADSSSATMAPSLPLGPGSTRSFNSCAQRGSESRTGRTILRVALRRSGIARAITTLHIGDQVGGEIHRPANCIRLVGNDDADQRAVGSAVQGRILHQQKLPEVFAGYNPGGRLIPIQRHLPV